MHPFRSFDCYQKSLNKEILHNENGYSLLYNKNIFDMFVKQACSIHLDFYRLILSWVR